VDAEQKLKRSFKKMSAAATAAGYLYASGRLRGRNGREDEQQHEPEQHKSKPRRKEVRVAVFEPAAEAPAAPLAARPKTTPKIQYRTRRWKPE
jgi:hypothetical protein